MQRRQFLHALLATSAGLMPATRLLAAPAAGNTRFLLVFLRGGYDCASLLVPTGSSFYYESRPNIAIPRPGAEGGALPLDANWSLHPAMAPHLHRLYQAGQAALVPFAGTEDLSRSHFETQDSIELGQPLGGRRDYQSGFLGRLAGLLRRGGSAPEEAIAFTDQLPLIFRGNTPVPNLALNQLGKPGLDNRQSKIISAMYQGHPLAGAVNEGFNVKEEAWKEIAGDMDASGRNAISAKGFELEARRVARLMRDKYHLGFVDVGGWDTHVGQGNAAGFLANRLDELGRGLAALADELGPRWQDTVVVVMSEFGRTFRENGNRGTDHGHGSVYWVLGGGIRGGRVAGEQVPVNAASLFQNRDYPVLTDYRSLLGGLLGRVYGLGPDALATLFPGGPALGKGQDLGLV